MENQHRFKGKYRLMKNNWTKLKMSAIKPNNKYANKGGSDQLTGKLLKLKYRLNDCYRDPKNTMCVDKLKKDRDKVFEMIHINSHDLKLSKGDMILANKLWRKYEGN